jgi:hypothetical protein
LQVTDHKTADSGPVALALNLHLYLLLKKLIVLNERLPGAEDLTDTSPVFRTYPYGIRGSVGLNSSQANQRMQTIWARTSKKPITATRIRQATATHVRDINPAMKDSLAAHMTHQPATADRFYKLHCLRESAMEVTGIIASTMEVSI